MRKSAEVFNEGLEHDEHATQSSIAQLQEQAFPSNETGIRSGASAYKSR